MKKYILAITALFVLSGCSALSVQADYDKEFDFNSLSTFSVNYTHKQDTKDFTRSNISKALVKSLKAKGYSSVSDTESDFIVRFYLDFKQTSEVVSTYETTTTYPLIRRDKQGDIIPFIDPLTTKTEVVTRKYDYEEGRLVVEIVDVKTNSVVWQGIAIDESSILLTDEEKLIEKLLKDFPLK